jgi:peroxiredoxin
MQLPRILLVCFSTWIIGTELLLAQQNPDGRLPVFQFSEPYLLLIRDPVVQKELTLSASQQQSLDELNAELDGALWTTRNQNAEKSSEIVQKLIQTSRSRLDTLLTPEQMQRIEEIENRVLGLRSLLRPEVIAVLRLTESQREKIRQVNEAYQTEYQDLQKQAQSGQALAALEKKNSERLRDAQKKIQATLKPEQRSHWQKLLGRPIDSMTLGFARLTAPELQGDGPWIHSEPLTLRELQGKVVVLHFWTFGCSNCIHNYPAYQNWLKAFAGRDVLLLGIHTPEGDSEHDLETLRRKASENQLMFPILVDNESKNWNAWGNSMWPTVYLIDKKGIVRYWWLGELNWQGQRGEDLFTKRIEELLQEE